VGVPHVTTQKLRFCDTDALGHINNAVYSVMLEAGRVDLFAGTGLLDRNSPHALVIARLELDFLREMNWPGEVRIESLVTEIGAKAIRMRQTLHANGTLSARARNVLAVIDISTRRSVPITENWRAALEPWLVPEA
jgi:acyl-CoA thioester hydrolase